MKIFVLTGSIAMGKTTVANYFRYFNIKVFCADNAIHKIYEKQHIIDYVKNIYEKAIINNKVDRKVLAKYILDNDKAKIELENILYKELEKAKKTFLYENKKEKLVVFDIPLYFEKNINSIKFDKIIVVYSNTELQKIRALQRKNLNENTLNKIIKLQIPIEEKIKKADYVIDNNGSLEETYQQIKNILNKEDIYVG